MKNNFSNLISPRSLSSGAANYKTWWKTTMLKKLEKTFIASSRLEIYLRDGVKKSKWKFKMAFAMKGGGLEGVSSATYLF